MRVLCNAPLDCSECAEAEVAMRPMVLAKHVEARLKNREVIALVLAAAEADSATHDKMLRDAAREAGLPNCPFVDQKLDNANAPSP